MRTAVKSGAAGEQTVAVANLANVLVCAARRNDCSRAAVLPKLDIVLGVESDNALARSTRCRLDTNAVFQIRSEQAVGISDTQVLLRQEGELFDIVNALDILGFNALCVHKVAVVLHVVVNVTNLLYDFLILNFENFLAGRRFNFRLVVIWHFALNLLQNIAS